MTRLTPHERQRIQSAYEAYDTLDLRPVVDEPTCSISSDCLVCHSGDTDPERIWRPLKTLCGAEHVRPVLECGAGCNESVIRAALEAAAADLPVDLGARLVELEAQRDHWRAHAEYWQDAARTLVEVTTDAMAAHARTIPYLRAAAA